VIAALDGLALAEVMRTGRWAWPLASAGHLLGIALLLGAIIPVDLRLLAGRGDGGLALMQALRPFATAGLALAALCGALLFLSQPADYAANLWFRAKLLLVGAALFSAALHLRLDRLSRPRQRIAAALSLALWPAALVCGRMIAFA
jgi:hypothetical protein